MKKIIIYFAIVTGFFAFGCTSHDPLSKIKQKLNKYPEYSIILKDMKEEGNFFPSYYHQYKVVYSDEAWTDEKPFYQSLMSDWHEVDSRIYHNNSNNLGMTIASKSRDGGMSNSQHPPGYQYVGNQRYGQWRTDSRGSSFWEFYGKYAMMSTVFGMFHRPIYRSGWSDYRRHRSAGRPYYGQNNEYGTSGSRTRDTNKSFFQRRRKRELSRRSSFANRIRRSNMSGHRSRGLGFGK